MTQSSKIQPSTEIGFPSTRPDSPHTAFALEQVARAEIHRNPFPHIIVEGLFPDSFFKLLLKNFPRGDRLRKMAYPGAGSDRTVSNYHDYGLACPDLSSLPFFGDVHALFKSEAFTRALLGKFSGQLDDGFWPIPIEKHRYFECGATDFTSAFDLLIDLPGYAQPPHPDVPSKIVTFQLFLSDDDSLRDYGMFLCKPKNGRQTVRRAWGVRAIGSLVTRAAESLRLARTHRYLCLERSALGLRLGIGDMRGKTPWSLVDIIKVVPALPNYFVAFPPNAISYHAARFDVSSGSRKQERPLIRGFIRAGAHAKNWIEPKDM
jgi:hypothetical protein